jgi:pSer/pThr/pTyr-binding forkhead associated (FHA) protein
MASLIFLSGELKGRKFEIDRDEISIGRSSTNVIPLEKDPVISGSHCKITRTAGGIELTDNDSTNGTFLNGAKITGTVKLTPRDTIQIGDIQFILDAPELVDLNSPVRTTTGITVKPGAVVVGLPADPSSPFTIRNDSKIVLILVMAASILVAIGLFAWFLLRLFE